MLSSMRTALWERGGGTCTRLPLLVTFKMFGCPLIRGGSDGKKEKQQQTGFLCWGGAQPPLPGARVRRLCWLYSPVNASDYGCQHHLSAGLKQLKKKKQ